MVEMLNNLMFGAINAITAEVLDLAERAELRPSPFVAVPQLRRCTRIAAVQGRCSPYGTG